MVFIRPTRPVMHLGMPERQRDDYWWREECNYIEAVTAVRGRVHEMNFDRETFLGYCRTQLALAESDGRHDSATYIQHCIDDLEEPK